MRMLKYLWLTLFAYSLAIQSANADSFGYSNLLDGRPAITIQTTPPMVTSGDRAVNANFCKDGAAFTCFTSEWISFSFPKKMSVTPSEWSENGFLFKRSDLTTVQVFGVCHEAYKVTSNQNGREFNFLYSLSHGLLGFSVEIDNQKLTYIAQNSAGFGAARGVENLQPKNPKKEKSSRDEQFSGCS